jgi:hypothetical protein
VDQLKVKSKILKLLQHRCNACNLLKVKEKNLLGLGDSVKRRAKDIVSSMAAYTGEKNANCR